MKRKDPYLKGKKKVEVKDYVQDFIPIKDIKYGIIETKDKRYIKIIEVGPINYALRSAQEQSEIIYFFSTFFRASNISIQFKSMTFKEDSRAHINQVLKDVKDEENSKTKELAQYYVDFVDQYGKAVALKRRFFIILEYESASNISRSNSFEDIYKSLQRSAQIVKQYLAKCGNEVFVPQDEEEFVLDLLYRFYNRKSSMTEPLNKRIERVVKDTMIARNRVLGVDEIPNIPKVNYIAPRGLEFKSNYMIMDGQYYTYLYLTSDGYKDTIISGWTSKFVNMGDGIDVDIFFKKESKQNISSKLSRTIRINRVNLKDKSDTESDFESLGNAYTSGLFIKQMLANNEDLYNMNIIITIQSQTLEGLMEKKMLVVKEIEASDFKCRDTLFQQEEAFLSVHPLLYIDNSIYRKSRRNVLTSSAASTYMFTSFQMSDDTGYMLGINAHNQSLCIVDNFNTKRYKNANMVIIGTSGSGKTFTMLVMALRMRMRGIQCFIIAPLKGEEFLRSCNSIGGQFVRIASGSKDSINIMEVRPRKESSEHVLEGSYVNTDSLLASKIQQLNIFFHLLVDDLTPEEEQMLDETMIRVYAHFGILQDNNTIYDENTGKVKTMPTLRDLYEAMKNDDKLERVGNILRKYAVGSASSFSRYTNVDLSNKYIVFDISKLEGKEMILGMFIALDYIWDKVKEDRTIKKAIIIDEAWSLLGSNRYAAEFVLEIFKIIRGYGGAAIAATQDISDFFALDNGKYGKGVINNAKTKIILQLEDEELDTVRDTLKLSDSECKQIKRADRGNALLISNTNKIPVIVKASELEEDLITTDREKITEQIHRITSAKDEEDMLSKMLKS